MEKRRSAIEIYRPVVWVVGASRGIGREIAKHFASIGCEVCLSARSKKDLQSVVKEITLYGGRAYSYLCDVSDEDGIAKTSKEILRSFKRMDVLVNNAGITVFKSFLDTTPKEFDDIIDTNLEGPILCIKAVLPGMIRRRQGWIFNILSNAAVKTFKGSAAYTATKAGMLGLAKVLREEVKKYNIKVVNVIPGPVDTTMWSRTMRRKHAHRMMKSKSVAEAVLAVFQMPDDVAVDELVIRPIQGDIE